MNDAVAAGDRCTSLRIEYSAILAPMYSEKLIVSPASPLNARRVFGLSSRVLSSEVLRMVAPRIAALEAAIIVEVDVVMPRRTSMVAGVDVVDCCGGRLKVDRFLFFEDQVLCLCRRGACNTSMSAKHLKLGSTSSVLEAIEVPVLDVHRNTHRRGLPRRKRKVRRV